MAVKKTTIDKDLIRDLAALLKEVDLAEIEVEQDDFRIRVSRATTGMPAAQIDIGSAPAPAASVEPAAPAPSPQMPADIAQLPGAVPSPMVGTVYLAPEPGARAFVQIGDKVRTGQTILIVEAMKHMNEVAAPRGGTVTEILVEDGQPVEFGEPLVIIE
ncbi:MAG TPA: acetyl-CoA carboxylase biotin carboxyl carrier protein [Afifellaceae bacterium]|nr:acetyl-CoA carboxylase biotin carboxyl carrier protein [Afifellaceae bacterium]